MWCKCQPRGDKFGVLDSSKTIIQLTVFALAASYTEGVPFPPVSPQFAFIYIFNLIVGVGALALPIAFSQAGLIIGTILMVILCSLAYMTATYVIEAMSVANALQRHRNKMEQAVNLQKGDESVSEMYGVCVFAGVCEKCVLGECKG